MADACMDRGDLSCASTCTVYGCCFSLHLSWMLCWQCIAGVNCAVQLQCCLCCAPCCAPALQEAGVAYGGLLCTGWGRTTDGVFFLTSTPHTSSTTSHAAHHSTTSSSHSAAPANSTAHSMAGGHGAPGRPQHSCLLLLAPAAGLAAAVLTNTSGQGGHIGAGRQGKAVGGAAMCKAVSCWAGAGALL